MCRSHNHGPDDTPHLLILPRETLSTRCSIDRSLDHRVALLSTERHEANSIPGRGLAVCSARLVTLTLNQRPYITATNISFPLCDIYEGRASSLDNVQSPK